MKSLSRISIMAAAASTLALAATSCGSRGGDIPMLDVTATYPAKNIVLHDIAEVEYIPLETREGFLVDFFTPQYIDDDIVITNNRAGDIMTFDRHTGKGIKTFNRTGRGPGEHPAVGIISVDKKAGEMFVTPGQFQTNAPFPIHVYDMEGKHLRTLPFGSLAYSRKLHDYDAEHLLGYDEVPAFGDAEPSARPYALISKRDTVVTPLPVSFAGRQTMLFVFTMDGQVRGVTGINVNSLAKTPDGGYMISEPGVDTMFRWQPQTGELTPVMTRKPSFASMEFPIGLFYWAENRDYMFLDTYERNYDMQTREGFDNVKLIYDKRSGEFFEGDLLNGDYVDDTPMSRSTQKEGLPAGTFVEWLQPFELLDLHAEGKLTGRLAEIAATLKEDDNPVMMIATFK